MSREAAESDGDGGLIRIGVIESIVHSWFPALMVEIGEHFPRLEIEVTSDTTIHLLRLLHDDAVDLILQTDRLVTPEFTTLGLCEFPMRWVASPELGLCGQTVDLARLADFPVVSFSRRSGPHALIERLFADAVDRPARINCISSVAAIIRLVADGFGVAVLPPAIIQRELKEGVLHVLDVQASLAPLPLVASYRSRDHPLASRIADLARESATRFMRTPTPKADPSP
jgi:DNA-binding transcriptional LysR family regulator